MKKIGFLFIGCLFLYSCATTTDCVGHHPHTGKKIKSHNSKAQEKMFR